MAEKTTYSVKNISKGPRGFHDATSGQITLDAGGTATGVEFDDGELESAKRTGYFEIHKTSAKAAKDQGDGKGPKVIEPVKKAPADMTDDELREAVKGQLGDSAPADADRQTMLALLA